MSHRVVIQDLSGDLQVGEIVTGKKAELLVARSIPSLPVDPNLLVKNAVAGYFKREYGKGIEYGGSTSGRGCPAVLYAVPTHQQLHWMARVIPNSAGAHVKGRLRLANDTAQQQVVKGGIQTAQFADIDKELDGDGTIIHGSSRFITNVEGYLGICLYGTLQNARVQWLAISQTK